MIRHVLDEIHTRFVIFVLGTCFIAIGLVSPRTAANSMHDALRNSAPPGGW